MFGRTKIAMLVAEFMGVAALVLTVLSISKSGVGFSYFLASGVGMVAGLMILLVGNVSGAQLNPALTLGLWTIKKIPTLQAIAYIAAQMFGGFVGWKLYTYLVDQKLESIANKSFDWRVFAAEAIGTFVFVFGVTAAIYQGYKGIRLAASVGASLFAGAIIASVASNGIVNPAVALGVQSWSRAYVFGPLLGGLVGAAGYALLFAPALSTKVAAAKTAPSTEAEAKITNSRKEKSNVAKKTTAKKVAAKKPTVAKKSTTKKSTQKRKK